MELDIPGDPVVKNLPSNAGDTGSISGGETKISQATGQLNPCASTPEPAGCNEGPVQTKWKKKGRKKKEKSISENEKKKVGADGDCVVCVPAMLPVPTV